MMSDKEHLKEGCELCEHLQGAPSIKGNMGKDFQVSTFILDK